MGEPYSVRIGPPDAPGSGGSGAVGGRVMRAITLAFGPNGIGFQDNKDELAGQDAYEVLLPRVGHGEIGRLVIERIFNLGVRTTNFELTGLRLAADPALFSIIRWKGSLWRLEEARGFCESLLASRMDLHEIR